LRLTWALSNLFISIAVLSIPILALGWVDKNKWIVGKITRIWAKWVLWSLRIKCEIRGLENLSTNGQYIFISNHESALDILICLSCIPSNIVFLAKKELFKIPIFGWAMLAAGMIKIDRQNKEMAIKSIDNAIAKIRNAQFSTLLFPEGTRSDVDELLQFKKGGFILAIRSELPVVPVTIIGAHSLLPKRSLKLSKGKIIFIIDEPIDTFNLKKEDKNKLLDQCRSTIIYNKKNYNDNLYNFTNEPLFI